MNGSSLKPGANRLVAVAEMRLSRVGHENCAPATFPLPLSSIHGYGYDLATVAVLIMLLDGDLIDVFGDFEARLRAGEWLLPCIAMGKLVLAEHRPVRGEDSPTVGVALR